VMQVAMDEDGDAMCNDLLLMMMMGGSGGGGAGGGAGSGT
jgi:hypothetical protein